VQNAGSITGELATLNVALANLRLEALAVEVAVASFYAAHLSPRHIQFGL
jgi:hypothetical protein